MLTQDQRCEIVQLYQNGYSIASIADRLKHGKNTINRYLQNTGIIRSKNKFSEKIEAQIVKKYQGGTSLVPLGEKYGCDAVTIINILKRHRVQRRPRGNSFQKMSQETMTVIKEMWENGKARFEIGNELKISHSVLDRYLTEIGFPIEIRIRSGEDHPAWKGGRISNGLGYVMVLLSPEDPFYSMANSMGYVLEHRYVMAKHIVAILSDDNSVHHIDGNRTNNTAENLELRKGKHLPGKVCQCNDCGSKNIVAISLQRTDYSNQYAVKLPKKSKLFSDEIQQQIIQECKFGTSISKISRKYNTCRTTIRNILLRFDINLTKYRGTFESNKEEFKNMWVQGVFNKEIEERFRISKSTLNRWVKKLGLLLRRKSAGGENHGNWNGGKTNTTGGYLDIFISKDDLYLSMANSQGYIPKHRYILAKHLGRPLTNNEKVHHIDGDKTNNAIENLQLVVQDHGRGQCYQCAECLSTNITDIPLSSIGFS